MELLDDVIEHRLRQSWVYADPEGIVHDGQRIAQISDYAVRDIAVSRLPGEVAAEQETGGDLAVLQVPDDIGSRERSVRTNRDREPEPARIASRRGFRQQQ